jgi:hypothetical protein
MFPRYQHALILLTFCCALIAHAVPQLTAQEDSPVRKLGKAVVEYRDKAIHIVVAYNYSQRNHSTSWLYLQAGLTTREDTKIRREDVSLRTPQRQTIALATQRQVGDDTKQVEQLLQNASSVSHDVPSYFRSHVYVEDMQLFRLPFGRIVHDEFIVDRDRLAVGPFFFESPTGSWENGTYALVVRHKSGVAELPIVLE